MTDKYGFKIKKVSNMWFDYDTGKLVKFVYRPDILSVQFRNHHCLTIPKKMYGFHKAGHRTIDKKAAFQTYFFYEHQLKEFDITIKRTPYLNTLHEQECPKF